MAVVSRRSVGYIGWQIVSCTCNQPWGFLISPALRHHVSTSDTEHCLLKRSCIVSYAEVRNLKSNIKFDFIQRTSVFLERQPRDCSFQGFASQVKMPQQLSRRDVENLMNNGVWKYWIAATFPNINFIDWGAVIICSVLCHGLNLCSCCSRCWC